MVSATADLARLRAPGRGLYGSGGVLFKDAIFGRDSAIAAEDLLLLNPEVSQEVILTLASLQGVRDAPIGPHSNEEEPGKIHHEHRSLYVGSRRISATSEVLLGELASRWGGDVASLTYYGSVDTTPLYVRLLVDWCKAHGDALLGARFTRRDGRTATVRESLVAALSWITQNMDHSDLGLVEFCRRNPDGIPFQAWKDSGTSYVHTDGTLADWDAPIAPVEVQAYAYDALLGAGELLDQADWRERAAGLRERILKDLWMPDEAYFAMGMDRRADGRRRRIESLASNGALALDTRLFEGLPDASEYVAPLIRQICGPDFLTAVGIRCRAKSQAGLVEFQDYHGAWTVWPKETFAVVRGLERQGLPRLAHQLGNRLLNAVNVARANVEFLYISLDGLVMYDFQEREVRAAKTEPIVGTNRPESPAAWTVSAAVALKAWHGQGMPLHVQTPPNDAWRSQLEAAVIAAMTDVAAFGTRAEIDQAYAERGDFVLDLEKGRAMDRRARSTHRGTQLDALET
jgi:glycogen debranching enzyme